MDHRRNGMLPRSTLSRTPRERGSGKSSARVQEIQRLIGRSLRAIVDLKALGERTVTLDCDVPSGRRRDADGSRDRRLRSAPPGPGRHGAQKGAPRHALAWRRGGDQRGSGRRRTVLDLNYEEDFRAKVDFNVVMSDSGELIEVQGTAEEEPFSRRTMDHMVDLAQGGIQRLVEIQHEALGGP